MPSLLSDAQVGLAPPLSGGGTAPLKGRLLSDDEILSAPHLPDSPGQQRGLSQVTLDLAPPPGGFASLPPPPPSPPVYFGPGGRALSAEELQAISQPRPQAPELSLPGKIAVAIQRASDDPLGAFSESVGTIANKLGLMSASDAGRLSRDIYAGVASLGPLGAEFSGLSAAPRQARLPVPVTGSGTAAGPAVTATPGPTRAGNLNLERIYAPEDVKQLLADTAATNADFIAARRGKISFGETRELASMLNMTPEKLMRRTKGQAFNAEQMFAARELLVTQASKVRDLARTALGGSDTDKLKFSEELTRLVAVQEQVSGATAEAGRTLSQFRMLAGAPKEEIARLVEAAKAGGLDDIIAKVNALDDPAQVARFASTALKAKTSDMLLEGWINALLSGPTTHATNILSNSLVALWSVPETAVAAGISKATGSGIALREAAARVFGLVEGAKDGLRAAWRAFRTEEPSDAASKIEARKYRAIPSVNIGGAEIGGKQIRLPGRLLLAEDEFFKAIGYRQELNALAMRTALREGLRGEKLAARVAELKANPTPEMQRAAHYAAAKQTFTNPLGRFGQSLMAMTREVPALRIVMPFVRTPINIVKFAAERSPFAPLFREVRETLRGDHGAAARDMQIARIGLGSAVSAAAAYLAGEGMITGGGPADPAERALKYSSGWQPYSLRIGDSYYSFNRLEPLGMLLGVAADFAELSAAMSEAEKQNLASLVLGSVQKNLVSKTWLRGLSEMIEAFHDPDRYGARYIQNLAGTLVPTGIAQIARTRDPFLREARSMLDQIRSRIPGLREGLPVKRDVFGARIELEGAAGPDLLSPVYQSRARNDPVIAEMLRLKVAPQQPSRTIMGVELEPAEYEVLQEETGKAIRHALDALTRAPAWASLADDDKKEAMEEAIRRARDFGRAAVVSRFRDLSLRIAAQRAERR